MERIVGTNLQSIYKEGQARRCEGLDGRHHEGEEAAGLLAGAGVPPNLKVGHVVVTSSALEVFCPPDVAAVSDRG